MDDSLMADLQLLRELNLKNLAPNGAARCPIHPFICEFDLGPYEAAGSDILKALQVRRFRSEHIASLESPVIAAPGYQPGTANDEIHTDDEHAHVFPNLSGGYEEGEIAAEVGVRNAIGEYVVDGKLWHVLLHSWLEDSPRERHAWVVLLAVGVSPDRKRLLGLVSHQLCHNFCD